MPRSTATTVSEYLAALPPERRSVITAMREFMRKHIPQGYEESMLWDAITWSVPLARFPNTYNGQPLCYAALASKKSYFSLHLMAVYGDSALAAKFKADFKKAGKRLDMGKACVRFNSTEDLALDAVRDALTVATPDAWVARYEAMRNAPTATRKTAARKKMTRRPKKTSARPQVARTRGT
jgi:hypothetical protein